MDEQPEIRILVLDRGYIIVCRCLDPKNYALWVPVTHSRTIRVWGTSEGLAELYAGPVKGKTKLDVMLPEEDIPVRAIIRSFKVSQTGWASELRDGERKVKRASATA